MTINGGIFGVKADSGGTEIAGLLRRTGAVITITSGGELAPVAGRVRLSPYNFSNNMTLNNGNRPWLMLRAASPWHVCGS